MQQETLSEVDTMTPEGLRRRLKGLYGADLSDRQLCIRIAEDMGLSSEDTARKWFNGVNPVPPYMHLILEALETRKARPR